MVSYQFRKFSGTKEHAEKMYRFFSLFPQRQRMKWLDNFLTSGHVFGKDEYEISTKIFLLNIMLLATSAAVFFLSLLQFWKINLWLFNGIYIAIAIFSIYYMRRNKKNYLVVAYTMIFVATVILTLALVNYPSESIRGIWYLILIAFSFFIDGNRGGLIVSIISTLDIIIVNIFSQGDMNIHSLILLLFSIMIVGLIISLYEKRERDIKDKLSRMNLLLEERVHDETQKLLEQKNAYQELAYYDTLTGLPNRALFNERLRFSIEKSKRNGTMLAILFIDLDNFKSINDLFGHPVGDEVLTIVANRIQKNLRSSDTLARLGGDEFTLILEDVKKESSAGTVAQILRKNISELIKINGHDLFITVSIGISIYPKDSDEADELLKCADTAMYSAKKDGKNLSHFYKTEMTEQLLKHLTLETHIRRGIENSEFLVHYQPIINAKTGKWVGLEALIRWEHPQQGFLGPDVFIPVAETSSLIISLGGLVLTQVARDMNRWHDFGFDPGFVSVNLSVKQLSYPNLLPILKKILGRVKFRHNWLELEITESYAFQKPNEAIELLQKIRQMGIALAIDDFGTGYSSLAYLKKLPVNKLKIDRTFVQDIPGNEEDETMVRTIIAMAKNLKLDVVAEGVETVMQKDFLVRHGCSTIQGYYYDKPMGNGMILKKYSSQRIKG